MFILFHFKKKQKKQLYVILNKYTTNQMKGRNET